MVCYIASAWSFVLLWQQLKSSGYSKTILKQYKLALKIHPNCTFCKISWSQNSVSLADRIHWTIFVGHMYYVDIPPSCVYINLYYWGILVFRENKKKTTCFVFEDKMTSLYSWGNDLYFLWPSSFHLLCLGTINMLFCAHFGHARDQICW